MRYLLVALCLLSSQGALGRLVGDSKCSWGPSYWCSGLPQSAKCGATNHCIRTLWNSNPYPTDDDEVCKICKDMVKQARDQLESNETMTEIQEVFDGSCDLIPIKVVANECKKLADDFVVELVETLASEMNPDTVCAVAGLCNSYRIDKMIQQFLAKKQLGTNCDVCKQQTSKMSLRIRLMPKADVIDKGLQLCGKLGPYSDACKLEVLSNFDDIYEALTHLSPICDLTGMCSETFQDDPTDMTTGEDIQCEFCEKVVQHWIDQWKANATEEEFKEVLESICKKLGQPERIHRCLHIVDDYYIPIFNYILNELDAHAACAAVGLCGNGDLFEIRPNVPVSVLLPQDSYQEIHDQLGIEAIESENVLIGGYFMPSTAKEMIRPGCAICEFVMYRLREWLKDEHTQDEINEALNAICLDVPSSLKDQCDNLLQTYREAIVELIIEGADPKRVCTIMDICRQPTDLEVSDIQVSEIAQMQQKNDNCATCNYVMEIVMSGIRDKDNQDEVRNVLESVCTLLPNSMSRKCESFIDSYAEMIIDMIAQNLTPQEICVGLGLCEKDKASDTSCTVCKFVVQTVDKMLEDKTNVEEIKHALETVCSYMYNDKLKQECTTFVDTYIASIADLIAHGATPEQVCQELNLCPNQHQLDSSEEEVSIEDYSLEEVEEEVGIEDYSSEEVEEDVQGDRPYCLLCEYAIGEVDQMIEDKQNEEEVREALDKICYKLSKPITKECLFMVDKYMDKIIDMFTKNYTPEKVCAALKLCKKSSAPVNNLNSLNDISRFDNTPMNQVQGKGMCTICEFGMNVLEKHLLNNRSMDMVEHAVLMMCSYIPGHLSDSCEEFVEQYGDQIIHLIVEAELSPEEICSEIGLCNTSTSWDATPVGGNRCNFGPALWCQSRFHMMQCGTAEFCQSTFAKTFN